MDNGKHFSPSNGQQPRSPKPVVPASRRSTSRGTQAKPAGFASRAASTVGSPDTSGGPRRPRWNKPAKPAIVVALVAALALVGVGGVLAWLVSTDSLTNTFEIGTVVPVVNEDGPTEGEPFKPGDSTKQNVTVTNNGSVDIYVRAQVNIYWVDNAGNQLWEAPAKDTDYTVGDFPQSGSSWSIGDDGYYYWTKKLNPKDETGNLIGKIYQDSDQLKADQDAGRKLVVDIDVQGIQADPAGAVQEAWKVTVGQDGTLNVGQGA